MTDGRKFGKVGHWNANSAYGFIAEDSGIVFTTSLQHRSRAR